MCGWQGVCGVLHGRSELDITVNRRMLDCSNRYTTILYPNSEGVEMEEGWVLIGFWL